MLETKKRIGYSTYRIIKIVLGEIKVKRFEDYLSQKNSQYPLDADLNLSSSSFSHKLRRRIIFWSFKLSFWKNMQS